MQACVCCGLATPAWTLVPLHSHCSAGLVLTGELVGDDVADAEAAGEVEALGEVAGLAVGFPDAEVPGCAADDCVGPAPGEDPGRAVLSAVMPGRGEALPPGSV